MSREGRRPPRGAGRTARGPTARGPAPDRQRPDRQRPGPSRASGMAGGNDCSATPSGCALVPPPPRHTASGVAEIGSGKVSRRGRGGSRGVVPRVPRVPRFTSRRRRPAPEARCGPRGAGPVARGGRRSRERVGRSPPLRLGGGRTGCARRCARGPRAGTGRGR